MSAEVWYFIARVALAGVAIWAAVEKLRDPSAFVRGLRGYDLMPRRVTSVAAACLIAIEIALGALLITDVAVPFAAAAGTVLFGVLAAAVGIDLIRGVRVPCHCFGASDTEMLSPFSLARAILLAIASAAVSALASNGVPQLPAAMFLPATTLAVAVVLAARLMGFVPAAFAAFTTEPVVSATRRHRTSLRALPMEAELRIVAFPSADLIPAEGSEQQLLSKSGGGGRH